MLTMTRIGQSRDSSVPTLAPVTRPDLPTTITPDMQPTQPQEEEYVLDPESGQYVPVADVKKKGFPWWGWLLVVLGVSGGVGLTIYLVRK